MAKPHQTRHRLFRWTVLLSMTTLVGLGACQHDIGKALNTVPLGPPDSEMTAENGTTMSFIGIDANGCEMYQPVAKAGEAVAQAIYFRTEDGQLSIDKGDAYCGVTMEPDGADGDGCEIYRAVWPNGETLDRPLYRVGNGYMISKGKSCG